MLWKQFKQAVFQSYQILNFILFPAWKGHNFNNVFSKNVAIIKQAKTMHTKPTYLLEYQPQIESLFFSIHWYIQMNFDAEQKRKKDQKL